MRSIGRLIVTAIVAGAAVIGAQAPKDATSVLAAAREALGGEKRLSTVKSFVATGRTKQVRGDNLVPIEFEIACELPDRYVRRDEIPAQESGPTSTGFNGGELIALPVPTPPPAMPGRAGGAGPAPAAQMEAMRASRVATVKQDFVRLTLGMFAASFSSSPVTFTYAGQAEAPQGKADVLDVVGGPALKMRLFINSETHLPIMVSWQAPTGPMRGMPPGAPGMPPGRMGGPPTGGAPGRAGAAAPAAGAAPGTTAVPPTAGAATTAAPPGTPPTSAAPPAAAPPAAASPTGAPPTGAPSAAPGAIAQGTPPVGTTPPPGAGPGNRAGGPPATPVEYRVYYGDYRDVNGMQWPFRLRRATGPDTTEETTFDGFKINTKIDPKKFEVRK